MPIKSIFFKVANEIALTNSTLVESNSETDLDDDIVDDAVEIKSLTPPEDLSYLWAPKVTEVCVEPKSPEDDLKSDTDKGESITKEEDAKKDGQEEGKERNLPELADEFAAEELSDLVAEKKMSKVVSEKVLPEERIGKEVSEKYKEEDVKDQKEVTNEKTLVPNDRTEKDAKGEKPKSKEDFNHVSTKKNRGNWTDVVFPEDSSKSLAKKTASTEEIRKGTVEKARSKEIADSQKSRSNWTDVVFKKDSKVTLETKMVTAKEGGQGEAEKGKVGASLTTASEQKSKSNWTDFVFKKDFNSTLATGKVPSTAAENEIQEKPGQARGAASFQNTFVQSVLKAAKKPPLLSEVLPKEVNMQKDKDNSKEDLEDAKMEILTVNGREDTEEAEIEKQRAEEMMKEEGTATEEEEGEANGSWKIDFIRVETEAKETGKEKKAAETNKILSKPRREKLSKRKKERRKERRKEDQAVVTGGSLYEENRTKTMRRPITVDTTRVKKSQTSEKVVNNEVRMTFVYSHPI